MVIAGLGHEAIKPTSRASAAGGMIGIAAGRRERDETAAGPPRRTSTAA